MHIAYIQTTSKRTQSCSIGSFLGCGLVVRYSVSVLPHIQNRYALVHSPKLCYNEIMFRSLPWNKSHKVPRLSWWRCFRFRSLPAENQTDIDRCPLSLLGLQYKRPFNSIMFNTGVLICFVLVFKSQCNKDQYLLEFIILTE